MIESHLNAGSQAFPRPLDELEYGVSVTDGCIDWESTEACLRRAAEVLDKARFLNTASFGQLNNLNQR